MFSLNLYRHVERRLWLARKSTKYLYVDAPGPAATQENNLAAVLICRDVEDYIDEWIRYHELAGIKHFYIYDNGSVDNTAAKALSHNKGGARVEVLPWAGNARAGGCIVSAQEIAYAHAICNYRHKHRWMAFIDIDEFIVPRQELTALDILESLQEFSNITLSWSQFGHCGHVTKPATPCIFSYTLRHQESRYHPNHFKCIVDPCQVTMISVHDFYTADMGAKTANDKGQVEPTNAKIPAKGFISSERLQLNHYRTKSIEENNAKIGLVMHGEDAEERKHRVWPQIEQLARNVVEDRVALDFLSRHGINNSQEYSQYIKGKT